MIPASSNKVDDANSVLTGVVELTPINEATLRETYRWLVDHLSELNLPPTHFGVPNRSQYVSFDKTRKLIEQEDWSKFDNLTLMHVKPERTTLALEFHHTTQADLTAYHRNGPYQPRQPSLKGKWTAFWTIDLTDARLREESALPRMLAFITALGGAYGYLFWMRRD